MTRKLPHLVLAAAIGLAACADDPLQPLAPPDGPALMNAAASAAPREHLLVFNREAPAGFAAAVEGLGGTVVMNHRIGVAVVSGLTDAAAAELGAAVGALHVEENPVFDLVAPAAVGEPQLATLDGEALSFLAGTTSVENPAGAILFANQWNMRLINAPAAWSAGRLGSAAVRVAILDTGIDYNLPDLAGLVDLTRSTSFVPQDDNFTAQFFPGRHVSTDLHYHGTNVATQVASKAFAFAGVTSKTTLMSVKVCGVLGTCPGVTQGMLYAIDNGADVLNMSLGGWFRKSAFPGQIAAYNRILNYARQQGVTVVVAAGNDANDLDRQHNIAIRNNQGVIIDRIHIPSFFAVWCDGTHVICVSSVRSNDVPSTFTNYGRSAIDVAAPGGQGTLPGIPASWVFSLCPQTSLLFNCAGGLFTIGVAGTSQATPHVAGLAALAVEDVGRNPARVRAYIRNSADAIGGGNTQIYGKGRINVGKAVGAL